SAPVDFLGLNYYYRSIIADDADGGLLRSRTVEVASPVTDMGWEIYPQGLEALLSRVNQVYGGIPIYITENGMAYPDEVGADGRVADQDRIDYLQAHFLAVHRAMQAGVNVKGYFVWSSMDNFEWAFGYSKRFGLVYVDYETQARIPKASAFWYRDVASSGELSER
ncbi:MAG: BglB2, partial [Firmicutes bacterium]|nr:BglB2 [Bacillota bacterium]